MIRKKITNFDVIRHSIDHKLGMQEKDPDKILAEKWDYEFFAALRAFYDHDLWDVMLIAMQRRIVFGQFRYGGDCPFQLAGFYRDCTESAGRRIQEYLKDNNLENLVDAANCFYIHWVSTGDYSMMGCILATFNLFVDGHEKGHKIRTIHSRKDEDRIKKRVTKRGVE